MKKLAKILSAIGFIAVMTAVPTQAQIYSPNTVGYATVTLQPGLNWIGNPLDLTPSPNLLSAVIPTAPDGTTVSLWNSTLDQYTPSSIFTTGIGWSSDLTLNPGTGVLLDTPSQFNNLFVGTVQDLNGSIWGGGPFSEPSPFAGPSGQYLLSSKAPLALSGNVFNPALGEYSVFQSIIGRDPQTGESVTTLNPLTQTYFTTTWTGTAWNNGDPSLAVGQAAMFNIGLVPEPSALGLLALGLGLFGILRRCLRSGAAQA